MYRLLFLFLLSAVVAFKNELETHSSNEIRSSLIVNQLLLAEQTEILKQLLSNSQRRQGSDCPYPYTKVLDQCFYLSKLKRPYGKARQYCKEMMGDMATRKHLYALAAFAVDKNVYHHVFMGIRDETKNGEFSWIDGTPVSSSDWAPGEPNRRGVEMCASMHPSYQPPLFDIPCHSHLFFICQYNQSQ
nr:C-type lectin [Cherax quadricarinatus]